MKTDNEYEHYDDSDDDYEFEYYAKCPYCGYDDTGETVEEDAFYTVCGRCEKLYHCETTISIDYTTRKLSLEMLIKDIKYHFNNRYMYYRMIENPDINVFDYIVQIDVLDGNISTDLFNFNENDLDIDSTKRKVNLNPSAITKIEKVYKDEILEEK